MKPMKVVFSSMLSGGGHNALRDSLMRSIEAVDPHGNRCHAVSSTLDFNYQSFYAWAVRSNLQAAVFSMTRLNGGALAAALTAPSLMREMRELILRERPDVLVATHLVVAAAAQLQRQKLHVSTRVIHALPDYGIPAPSFFPRRPTWRADAYLVRGPDTYEWILDQPDVSEDQIHWAGTLAAPAFAKLSQRKRLAPSMSVFRAQVWNELKALLPELATCNPNLPTVLFLGGSGWARKADPVLQRLLRHETLQHKINVVVICGRDDEYRQSLQTQTFGKTKLPALGFVSADVLARLFAVASIPVLGSLADASLHELLEVGLGPFAIFHLIPGTEPPYLPFIKTHRLGIYQPNPDLLLDHVMQWLGMAPLQLASAHVALNFSQRAETIRSSNRRQALKLLPFLERFRGSRSDLVVKTHSR